MDDLTPTIAEAVDKLVTLGSADQIAQFFELQGIQGLPHAADFCPVSRFVSRETSIPVVAAAAGVLAASRQYRAQGVSFWDDVAGKHSEVYTPVREFINNFDEKKYPQLIIEREPISWLP